MIYTLDTEFRDIGRNWPIELISLGIKAEDGRTWYGVNKDFNWDKIGTEDWLSKNVLPKLNANPSNLMMPSQMRASLESFFSRDQQPDFWGYYADWDWMNFRHIFGTVLFGPPEQFPQLCMDIEQFRRHLHLPSPVFPRPDPKRIHNSLYDAEWTMDCLHILEAHNRAQVARMSLGRV